MDHGAVLPAEMTERPVLVVRAPNLPEEGRASLRDYVVDSLRLGVLIIWPGVSYSLERFPQLGGVHCCGAEPTEKEEPKTPLPGQETVVAGQEELLREHSVDCSPITADLLRDMLVGAASPNIAQWRQVNEALATLEAWEAVSGGQ